MENQDILYKLEGNIAVITLNRPDTLNALTLDMHSKMEEMIREAGQDDNVRVIIITGAGRGFCSGDDVKDLFLSPEEEKLKGREVSFRQLKGEHLPSAGHPLLEINKPSIAAVNGAAVGYGCDLALMCNMRIASEKAKFGEVFVNVGLMPDESMAILPRLVGLAKAYELFLTGNIIDAKEAERIGMVNRVVPHEELMKETMELADRIASRAPIAIQLTIEGVRRGLNWNIDELMEFHARAFTFCTETEDHREGAQAFVEKRPPVFKGK